MKSDPPKHLNRVKFDINKAEKTGLVDRDLFAISVQQNGLFFPSFHLRWLAAKDLIIPLKRNHGKKYYSHFQLPLLDIINGRKEDTLEYPNPKFFSGRQLEINGKTIDSPGWIQDHPVLWQDHVIVNKESILEGNKEWNNFIRIIHLASQLFSAVQVAARKWYDEDKLNGEEVVKAEITHHLQSLKSNPGNYYAKQIRDRVPDISSKVIRYWATGTLPAYVIKHNPLYQQLNQYPRMQEVFDNFSAGKTIFRKGNEIALANFYVWMIRYASFYLECLEGRGIDDIKKITARVGNKGIRYCAICHAPFSPKSTGRENILCPKESCQKERDRLKAKERRKRVKRVNKSSV